MVLLEDVQQGSSGIRLTDTVAKGMQSRVDSFVADAGVAREVLELHSRWNGGTQGGEHAVVCEERGPETLNAVSDEVCEFWVYVLSDFAVGRVEVVDEHNNLGCIHRV